ncbi:MAG TPA: M28 family peptidase [Vicinamibacterales bacterium]
MRSVQTFRAVMIVASLAALGSVTAAQVQSGAGRGGGRGAAAAPVPVPAAWFGVPLPSPFGKEPAVIVGSRTPTPFVMPPTEAASPELTGAAIRKDLDAVVAFATESRTNREVGSGQLWGRISGLPSSIKTVEYVASQWRAAGITDVKVQPIAQEPNATFWFPLSWEVRLLGDTAFGPDSGDVVLTSAMPVTPSMIASGRMEAPLVYVGDGSPAVLEHVDVKGKIAVQLVVPQGHMLFERGTVADHSRELLRHGAAGVFNLVRLPGNELSHDYSNCGNPCFNFGGHDGAFIENVLNRAAAQHQQVWARISLTAENKTHLTAENAVATIPGTNPNEILIIDSHVDSWFDGAGDNAGGVAVMIALSRHFAKPENKPGRTVVFIASAGHHSPGLNGLTNFNRANPDLVKQAVLGMNIEHVAQRNFSLARTTASDGYRQSIADSGEAPAYGGVSNASPYLDSLMQQGVLRYGVNFVSEKSTVGSGETGGLMGINGAKVTIIQAPPLYHTTGEVLDVISTPGLERMARFLSYFITDVGKAPLKQINP